MSEKIELTELNTATVLKIMAKDSIDTLFFDNNGKEYLRIGVDNIPADVYEKFTNWCMQLPPLNDAEITRLQAEVARLTDNNEQLAKMYDEQSTLTDKVEAERDAMRDRLRWRDPALEVPDGPILVLSKYGEIDSFTFYTCNDYYTVMNGEEYLNEDVVAWLPLPSQ